MRSRGINPRSRRRHAVFGRDRLPDAAGPGEITSVPARRRIPFGGLGADPPRKHSGNCGSERRFRSASTLRKIPRGPAPGALLAIHDADHVRLADNFLEAATAKSLDITNEIFHL